MTQQVNTGVSNQHYDLVSVLYHALQASTTYSTYIQDAQQQGDQELAQFLQQVQQEDKNRAQKAAQLLAARVGK